MTNVIIGGTNIGTQHLRDWLERGGKNVSNALIIAHEIMETISSTSDRVSAQDPAVTDIVGRLNIIRSFVQSLRDCMRPIPTDLSPKDLLTHPDVVSRHSARNKLKFSSVKSLCFDTLVANIQALLTLHTTPTLNKEIPLDSTDRLIISTRVIQESRMESRFCPLSTELGQQMPTGTGHGCVVPLFSPQNKPIENIEDLKLLLEIVETIRRMIGDLFVIAENVNSE